jgi:hypothetical protein
LANGEKRVAVAVRAQGLTVDVPRCPWCINAPAYDYVPFGEGTGGTRSEHMRHDRVTLAGRADQHQRLAGGTAEAATAHRPGTGGLPAAGHRFGYAAR